LGDRASYINKYRYQLDAANDLLVFNKISTCFGHVFAHLQEFELPFVSKPVVFVVSRSRVVRCVHCDNIDASSINIVTVHTSNHPAHGHNKYNRFRNKRQFKLLKMGENMPETC
jgi:hypothetical protein